jgi:hypothetical protein
MITEDITGVVRIQRLRWLGYVERMDERRIPRCGMVERRRKGRWKAEAEEDLRERDYRVEAKSEEWRQM